MNTASLSVAMTDVGINRVRNWLARAREPWSGYSHLAGLGLALVGACWLAAKSTGQALYWSFVVYAFSLIAVFATSAAYHLVNLGDGMTQRLRRLDHAAIFLLIAGTTTPLVVRALSGDTRKTMLLALWGAATLGILFRTLWFTAPRWLYTSTYVATGWIVAFQWRAMIAGLPREVLTLFLLGAGIYIAGSVVYATKKPNPYPNLFGFHEVWHVFVLAASGLHFAAVAALI